MRASSPLLPVPYPSAPQLRPAAEPTTEAAAVATATGQPAAAVTPTMKLPAITVVPPPPKPKQPSTAERLLAATEHVAQTQDRIGEMQHRLADVEMRGAAARGDAQTRTVPLYGEQSGIWKNPVPRMIGVEVEVVRASAVLGATVTVNRHVLPADMAGARSRVFVLEPNDGLDITFSDADIGVELLVSDPEAYYRR